jgi:hypothetical protein
MQTSFWLRLLILGALLSASRRASAQRIPADLGDRHLELGLLQLSDRALTQWPDTEVRLITESVIAGSDRNLSGSLAENGIEPDVGAYSLFYELNPQVIKANDISPKTKLLLPKIVPDAKLRPLLESGKYLVVLFIDSDLRSAIADASVDLHGLNGRIRKLQVSRFSSIQEQASVASQVQDLDQWYGNVVSTGLQRKGPPLNRETLEQLRDEAAALSSVITSFANSNVQLSVEDRRQIDAIHSDVEREIRRYDEVMSGTAPDPDLVACCTVVVAIRGDPKVVVQLRVYYTLYGLFRNPPPGPVPGSVAFTELGSDKSKTLRAKNYMFWAAREGDPNVLVTQPIMVPLEADSNQKPTKVDLVLMPGYEKPPAKGVLK